MNEYLLEIDLPVIYDYKIVGNVDWGFTFAVAVRFSPYYFDL